ncbi:unnamed protein product [Clavelina lepadiformis]|uniref:Uncharacterized protein n=1 Tax=Clavelina lepadiformis TaxID=159417 RepID=A0ABP0GW49_CLALP
MENPGDDTKVKMIARSSSWHNLICESYHNIDFKRKTVSNDVVLSKIMAMISILIQNALLEKNQEVENLTKKARNLEQRNSTKEIRIGQSAKRFNGITHDGARSSGRRTNRKNPSPLISIVLQFIKKSPKQFLHQISWLCGNARKLKVNKTTSTEMTEEHADRKEKQWLKQNSHKYRNFCQASVPTDFAEVLSPLSRVNDNCSSLRNGAESMPVIIHHSNEEFEENIKQRETLEKENKDLKEKIRLLTDMNMQWQLFHRQKNTEFTTVKNKLQKCELELSHLRQEKFKPDNVMTFTPIEQKQIDQFYQRLRREADQYRQERDAARQEALKEKIGLKKKEEVALKRLEEKKEQNLSLEREVTEMRAQLAELQSALIVATRFQ